MNRYEKAKETRKETSGMMTQFLRDFEKFTGRRVTPELIRSAEWKEAVKIYISLFRGLMEKTS